MISQICEIEKIYTNKLTYKVETDFQVSKIAIWLPKVWQGGINQEFGINTHIPLDRR